MGRDRSHQSDIQLENCAGFVPLPRWQLNFTGILLRFRSGQAHNSIWRALTRPWEVDRGDAVPIERSALSIRRHAVMDVASSQYEFGFFVSDFGWQSKISTLTGGLDDIDRASDAHAVHRRRLRRPNGTSRARRRRRGLGRSARHAGTRPGTGHGIRVATHEPPYIVEGEEQLLVPGMCFSIEPGIYLAGRFGIRIDDIVTVTEDGGRRLNNTSHDLRVVD